MWFKFPPETYQINVEQQNFVVEAEDKDGNRYFRAPDHFAPTILSLPGFSKADRPEGGPEDLPKVDPQRADEVESLAAELQSARDENQLLRQQLGEARRERDATQTRHDELSAKLKEQETKPKEEPARASTTSSSSQSSHDTQRSVSGSGASGRNTR